MSSTFSMIDPLQLVPCRLREAPAGSIFVQVAERPGDDEFPLLVGKVATTPVLIALRGDRPFHVAQPADWSQRSGYFIENIRVEVDRSRLARRHTEEDCAPGDIIRYPGGWGIVGNDGRANHIVDVWGELPEDAQAPVLLAFRRWEIVKGEGGDRQVLYHFTGRELLFGEFDPEIDEED